MLRFLTILLILCFAGCRSAKERAASRLDKILTAHPDLLKTDTVTRDSIIVVPGARTDSVFYFRQVDTVRLRDRNLTVKYYLRPDSTVYLSGNCDTVRLNNRQTTITRNIRTKEKFVPVWVWLALGAATAVGILGLISIRK